MNVKVLKEYAFLIAKKGINVQVGQEVFISAQLDQIPFVRILTQTCYELGAKSVTVDWADCDISKMHYKYRSLETLSEWTKLEKGRFDHYLKTLPCRIYLLSEDPDWLEGADFQKIAKASQVKNKYRKPYLDKLENRYQWCIAAVPGKKWAKKVFPSLSGTEAEKKLWSLILHTSRAEGNSCANWDSHNKDIHNRCAYLNGLGIKSLHYSASNGTDFTVSLIEGSVFRGGSEKSLAGIEFNPNIPSEEVFISPNKNSAEGIVYSSKPLAYNGVLIKDFFIRFSSGKAVEWNAAVNNDVLTSLIKMDKGSCRLGECAFVPYDSPVSNTNTLFLNTLFDENAACHLALGRGFADSLEDFNTITLKECYDRGINESFVHEDFMIGTKDLNIDAVTKDNRTVPVFRNGNWAF